MGSKTFKPLPSICIVVPVAMVVFPEADPNADPFFASITPVLNVVNPV